MEKPTAIADPGATLISLEQRVAKLEEKPATVAAPITVMAPESKPESKPDSKPESKPEDDAWFARWFGGE
jgi:hypothetical protein